MKRITSAILVLVMAIGICTSVPFTVNSKAVSDSVFTFVLNDDGVSYAITDCSSNVEGELVIPDSYNGLPVTSIDESAFSGRTDITDVKIPDSVTSIGFDAFYDTAIYNDPDSWEEDVLYIDKHLIVAKESLSGSYAVKPGTKTIADAAFVGCEYVVSVEIPDTVTSIGIGAFARCTALESIELSENITSIEAYTFVNCTNLDSVNIPNGATSIGSYAFWCCSDLDSVSIPDSVTSIGGYAFVGCTDLASISIPDSVMSIGSYAFYGCEDLASISIPDSVISIDRWAFAECTGLISAEIGAGATKIETDVFDGCVSLVSISVDEDNKHYSSSEGLLFNKNKTELCLFPKGKKGSYVIPDSVTGIGESAFSCCDALTAITIPYGVTSIGEYAFFGCTGLESVVVPGSVTTWGSYVFSCCENLKSVVISEGITEIGYYAFDECRKIESIVLPKSLQLLGHDDFELMGVDYVFYAGSDDELRNILEDYYDDGYAQMCWDDSLYEAEIHYNSSDHTAPWVVHEATVYESGCKYRKCTVCGKVLESVTLPQLKPATPKLTKIANTSSGVKVTWGKVDGADSYIVYRRTYNAKTKDWGGWTRLADGVTSASYVDKTVKTGTYYRYTVKAVNEAGNSGYNTSGIKTYFLSTPTVSATNVNSGVTVKWSKSTGATGYYVYRKTGTNGWTKIATVKGAGTLSYNDKKATPGVTYRYTVKAYYSSYVSSFVTNGLAVRRLATPKLTSAVSKNEGILLKWNKVTGATGYVVYRKASSGEWKAITTVKGNTKVKYLDETPRKGATYQYCIKAYYGTSKSTSSNTIKLKCKY